MIAINRHVERGSLWACRHCGRETVTVPGSAAPACGTCDPQRKNKSNETFMEYRGGHFSFSHDNIKQGDR